MLHAEPEDPITEEELPQEDPMEIHESSHREPARQDKRRKAVHLRTEKLGQNPRESRQLLREQLQSGFYLSYTGRKSFRILHRLGPCYNLPGLDSVSARLGV